MAEEIRRFQIGVSQDEVLDALNDLLGDRRDQWLEFNYPDQFPDVKDWYVDLDAVGRGALIFDVEIVLDVKEEG